MQLRHSSIRFVLTLSVLLVGLAACRPALAAEPTQTSRQVQAALQRLPFTFEANEGQTDRRVQFLARGQGYSLFLTSREAVLVLRKASQEKRGERGEGRTIKPLSPFPLRPSQSEVLRMQLLGANPHAKASGQERLPGQTNYFLGNDPRNWRTNVPTYQKVRYQSVYPGIDLVYYGNPQQLEYDFVVKPGANPSKIALSFAGVERLRIDKRGELVLQTAGGEVRWHRPVVYQEIHGKRKRIAAKYALLKPNAHRRTSHRVGFQVARYDATRPLVIDPVLAYSTYLGGSVRDVGIGIAVDAAGYVYVTGHTASANFPTRNIFQDHLQGDNDAFVTKLDPTKAGAASLLYSTFLGGSAGDVGIGIAVDAAGYVYVSGFTQSSDFPTRNAFQNSYQGGYSDAFVTKLDTTQSGAAQLLYSTYLGGSTSDDGGTDIAVDAAGCVYVTGSVRVPNSTFSSDFPIRNAFQDSFQGLSDAFVTKLDTTRSGAASLLYSTFLGGSDDSGGSGEGGGGIAVDAAGYVYVAGGTTSSNFPTRNAFQDSFQGGYIDAFVTKLDITRSGTAQLLYSTYLGGSLSRDSGGPIAVDGAGHVYISGYTESIQNTATSDFPIRNAFQASFRGNGDAFVTKLDTTKSGAASLLYSTFLGGNSRNDIISGLAIDGAGYVYVTGTTGSSDFPIRNAYQDHLIGFYSDAFVTKLDTTQTGAASLLYSTYLGGGQGAGGDYGYGIAVDGTGNIYVTGETGSSDFPRRNALQDSYQGGNSDAFVTRFAPDLPEASISGRITLEDCLNPVQPLTFTFRPTDGSPAFSRTLTLNANGAFTLTNVVRKNYLLAIKGAKWLRKVVSVNASNGNVSGVTATLQAGDANDDNMVDVNDLAALIQAFDADPTTPNWNSGKADFDCNDIVDVDDLALLIRNFDQAGDP